MARQPSKGWTIVHEYAREPDRERCASALVTLLLWAADAPTAPEDSTPPTIPPQDPACGEVPREAQQDKQAGACAENGDVQSVEPS